MSSGSIDTRGEPDVNEFVSSRVACKTGKSSVSDSGADPGLSTAVACGALVGSSAAAFPNPVRALPGS